MITGGKYNVPNRLWIARKRRGLRQKQVAFLLNHHTVDQVSRYEKGLRRPTFEVALMLEIIYGTPLRMLFKDLYEELQQEIMRRTGSSTTFKAIADGCSSEELNLQQFCAYLDILNTPSPHKRT